MNCLNCYTTYDDVITSTINALNKREESGYLIDNYYKPPVDSLRPIQDYIHIHEDLDCRKKICEWTIGVIDHFDLSRQTFCITIDLFDRYFATRGNRSKSDLALLTALTSLYVAIKVNEKKKIALSTLVHLSRFKFTAEDIEGMEMELLTSLSWLVHPPTAADYITQLVLLLPPHTCPTTMSEICQSSRYNSELAVCDPFFIEQSKSSIALASILNTLEDEICYKELPLCNRETFINNIEHKFNWIMAKINDVNKCRDRLRVLKWEQEKIHSYDENENTILTPDEKANAIKRTNGITSPTSVIVL